ncbi:hypothetical protein [Mycobacterium lepromatosis]|uniref:hypothetical protein n=1 Tax=Mycobacterium lepromatosis TaxID=480418 RepID=UPI000B141BFB|nr:hypothetical protein [Mycobacterium lepromatosis]
MSENIVLLGFSMSWGADGEGAPQRRDMSALLALAAALLSDIGDVVRQQSA